MRETKIFRKGAAAVGTCIAGWAVLAGVAFTAGAAFREWSFEVIEVIRVDREEHVIRLRPVPPGPDFPRSCGTFIIHAYYDLEDWSAEGRRFAPRSGHERSLQLLTQAQVLNTLIRIRSIGYGFGSASESNRCEVTSRALNVASEPGREPVIFSLYEDPKSAR